MQFEGTSHEKECFDFSVEVRYFFQDRRLNVAARHPQERLFVSVVQSCLLSTWDFRPPSLSACLAFLVNRSLTQRVNALSGTL